MFWMKNSDNAWTLSWIIDICRRPKIGQFTGEQLCWTMKNILSRTYGLFRSFPFTEPHVKLDGNSILSTTSNDCAPRLAGSYIHLRCRNASKTSFEEHETRNRTATSPALLKPSPAPLNSKKTSTEVQADSNVKAGLNPYSIRSPLRRE